MKAFTSILLIFIISVRSFLPLLDYVIHYHYIATQLCENRDKPELLCNGKCYLKKQLNTEQNKNHQCELKIQLVDLFIPNENITFEEEKTNILTERKNTLHRCKFSFQNYFSKFFHPPLI